MLIRESRFNSIVVKDDSNHANGTAKVILQGRKYGLGCIIVTQRTANVTKSILNQCNTIFALRVRLLILFSCRQSLRDN